MKFKSLITNVDNDGTVTVQYSCPDDVEIVPLTVRIKTEEDIEQAIIQQGKTVVQKWLWDQRSEERKAHVEKLRKLVGKTMTHEPTVVEAVAVPVPVKIPKKV